MTAPASRNSVRLHELDALRSILMLLGIVLHAANPYRIGSTWLVRDPSSSPVFTWLVDFVHLFRMPGFFLVAGYFGMLSLLRRDTPEFLRERLTRLLIPCVTTLFLLNIPQTLFLDSRSDPDQSWGQILLTAWLDGRLVGHLWFLVDLSLYIVILAAFAGWIRRVQAAGFPKQVHPSLVISFVVAAGACWAAGLVVLDYFGPAWLHQQVGGLINPVEWLTYAPFFAAGALVYSRPPLLPAFSSPRAGHLLVAVGAATVMALMQDMRGIAAPVVAAASAVIAWYLVRLCFAAFRKWATRPSAGFRLLSEASYTVYLVHHIAVVGFATLLLPTDLPAGFKFAISLTGSTLVALGVYLGCVRRSPLLTYLFNGTKHRSTMKPGSSIR